MCVWVFVILRVGVRCVRFLVCRCWSMFELCVLFVVWSLLMCFFVGRRLCVCARCVLFVLWRVCTIVVDRCLSRVVCCSMVIVRC